MAWKRKYRNGRQSLNQRLSQVAFKLMVVDVFLARKPAWSGVGVAAMKVRMDTVCVASTAPRSKGVGEL